MSKFYQSNQWQKLRKIVLKRDNYCCVVCKSRGKGMTVDHIKPRKEFPHLELDVNNLRTLCKSCDNKRHSEKPAKKQRPEIGLDGYPVTK